jgi:hypothetical protein
MQTSKENRHLNVVSVHTTNFYNVYRILSEFDLGVQKNEVPGTQYALVRIFCLLLRISYFWVVHSGRGFTQVS